ncbi:M4 family metallopeptidase [Bordetella bronchiseptica]
MKRPTSKAARPSVVPPYLLDRLAQAADARLSARAVNTLRIDTSQRAVRLAAPPAPASARPPGQVDRQVHDAGGGLQLPGALARSEGQPAHADVAVNEAYDHLGATYALFWQAYGRHSLDGAGRPLVASVHYGEEYENAFWNGAQMVFGDGDGEVFNRFTIAVDIVAHELTHGVIDHEGGLRYEGQSGALNESLCDVFGSLAKQHVAGQRADQADWLIGAGLFTAKVQARALRSMAQPGSAYDDPLLGRDPQPGHMRDFVQTGEDNGGVHINSGIPNRAFHLAAIALGGHAWEVAGRIWYDTLRLPALTPQADFALFARLSVEQAGRHGAAQAAVRQAWTDVGVLT